MFQTNGLSQRTNNIALVGIFLDTAPYSPYVKRRFGGAYHLHLQGRKSAEKETGIILPSYLLHTGFLLD
jgi:hypothetical protein